MLLIQHSEHSNCSKFHLFSELWYVIIVIYSTGCQLCIYLEHDGYDDTKMVYDETASSSMSQEKSLRCLPEKCKIH